MVFSEDQNKENEELEDHPSVRMKYTPPSSAGAPATSSDPIRAALRNASIDADDVAEAIEKTTERDVSSGVPNMDEEEFVEEDELDEPIESYRDDYIDEPTEEAPLTISPPSSPDAPAIASLSPIVPPRLPSIPVSSSRGNRPIVMIVVDSLMDAPLREATQTGDAPAMKYLMDHGHYYPRLVTSFPTMSVCVDTTLLTGVPPSHHHIFGLTYFHRELNRVVNFGTGFKEAFRFGVRSVLRDSLQNLNQQFISKDVKTIHEELDEPTGSINGLVYRGKYQKRLTPPLIAGLLGITPRKIVTRAPSIFSFGSMAKLYPNTKQDQPWFRFGMNDAFSRMELVSLIYEDRLPAFTLVYFPTNDEYVHKRGSSTIRGILKADQELQEILNAYPTWEEAIDKITFIIVGDSGQTTMFYDPKQRYINLRKLLPHYTIMPTFRQKPRKKDDLILCVNERMAYIYVWNEALPLKEVAYNLKEDQRIDVIAWKEGEIVNVISGQVNGRLQFKAGGDFIDEYQNRWQLVGDTAILDLKFNEQKEIQYGLYPDALFRLYNVMDTSERAIVITCAPGYEMVSGASPTHKGASHGSLHHLDSLIPMIVCGTDVAPDKMRLVDLKDWIVNLVRG